MNEIARNRMVAGFILFNGCRNTKRCGRLKRVALQAFVFTHHRKTAHAFARHALSSGVKFFLPGRVIFHLRAPVVADG